MDLSRTVSEINTAFPAGGTPRTVARVLRKRPRGSGQDWRKVFATLVADAGRTVKDATGAELTPEQIRALTSVRGLHFS